MAKYIDKADIIKLINDSMLDLSDSDDLNVMLTEVKELPTVTINDHPDEIKVTNCNHNADDSKMVSSSWSHKNGKDTIYRYDVIDTLNQYYCAIEQANGRPVTKEEQAFYFALKIAFAWLPSAQTEKRTDKRTETHACENTCDFERKSNDMISRQEAIEAIRKLSQDDGYINLPHEHVTDAVRALPSVQPEHEEFEWCHDCKEYDQTAHCCHRWTKVIRQTVEEIKAERTERKTDKCVWCDSPYRIEYYWIDREGCTASFQDEERHMVATGIAKFCPNCGRKLRGEHDG